MGHVVKDLPGASSTSSRTRAACSSRSAGGTSGSSTRPSTKALTDAEKRKFHLTIQSQIWKTWSLKTKLTVAGTAGFARKFAGKKIPVAFSVSWVALAAALDRGGPQAPPGSTPTTFISNVDRPAMQINLDSADILAYTPSNAAGASRSFQALPHEFGHTFPGVDDEYDAGDPNLADTNSIMNIGDEVRARHLGPLLGELNTMIADCTFSFP